jgi:flagellar motor switch protein FliM
MANEIDQDALAAEWGVALEAEHDGAAVSAAATAAGNDVVPAEPDGAVGAEAMAAQWASMVDDGHFMQAARGGAERILTQ